jgi:8-oxo-dGTP pyrophosphatase MutT (NUDIX family)
MICSNCEQRGHVFKECHIPISSYGILGYKKNNDEIYFLMIQRKDTIGYIDFLRGKYDLDNHKILEILFSEMTARERNRIKSLPFDKLWDDLWVNHRSRVFITEKKSAKAKFNSIDFSNIIDSINGKWDSQEFCIPKGRKNNNEAPIECAIREFKEETGVKNSQFKIDYSLGFLSEKFTGSNNVKYIHDYVIAEISDDYIPKVDNNSIIMIGEVKNISWLDYKQAMNILRDYDSSKRSVIYKAYSLLKRKK